MSFNTVYFTVQSIRYSFFLFGFSSDVGSSTNNKTETVVDHNQLCAGLDCVIPLQGLKKDFNHLVKKGTAVGKE